MVVKQRAYGGQSASARTAQRREQLLRAGLALIGEGGVQAVSVRGVLERAKLAPRYFYENFTNLDELIVAIFDQVLQEVVAAGTAPATDTRRDMRSRVRDALSATTELLVGEPAKGRILVIDSLTTPALVPLREQGLRMIGAIIVVTAQATDPMREVDLETAEITAMFLVGGFAELVAALLKDNGRYHRDAVIDRCTDLFLAARETALTAARK
ncbi:TetR/AcrR family transcriptional regulator [Hoyosella altamirensis]|uniref:AcrR family transcriptional regulator n=1 Tax=Hoyosella altamirensis TaxID=616997 RepID=A0A839RLZ6_9ACTN|nr:TetR family transcriptional regulator [Hoyosella altamirensis]MBB3037106.1 AcrR family transcriptional regulator [Hoyosella altamirensis]